MADIALRTYYKHIDQLIDQKNLEEALAYCKNILHHFPKDLEAYRLMGKALLERGRHGDAADVFQRVLSAQPDDFISHVGMAIVREDEGNLEAALWHMERAFEASPSNPAVQDELRRLYGRRDGIVPHRAQLTRGALARLYYKQGLYAQAETELRAGLSEQPDRPDLITLLVQVLWENGSRAEAGTLCQDLLQRLPHNLEANRVMAQIAASENRADEARACRARLEALDPYEAYVSAGTSAASVNADAIRITEVAYSPELAAPQQPEWSNTLGADLSAQSEDVLPDWVRSGTSLLVSDDAAGSTAGPTPDLPDWMRATTGILNNALGTPSEPTPAAPDLSAEPAEPVDEPAPLPTTDFLPDWLTEVANPAAEAESPARGNDAWLNALTTDTETAAAGNTAQAASDLPDWLRGAGADAADETPAWLKDQPVESHDDAGWLGAPASEPASDDSAPLTAAALGAAGAGALLDRPEETAPQAASGSDLPDWLQSAAGDATTPDWLNAATASSDATPSPDWMRVDAPAPADDSVFADDAPEWLRGATGQTGMLGGAKPPESSQPAAFNADLADGSDDAMEAAADIPAWLESARPETESAPLDASVPDWLSSASKQTGTLGDLPDWLKSAEPSVNDVTLPAATVEEPPIPDATIDVRAVDPQGTSNAGAIDLPDWLTSAAETPAAASTDAAEPGSYDADAFAWLESLAARQGADPAELSTPQTDTGDDIPDWLRTPSDAAEPVDALPVQPEAAAPEAASTPDAMDADDAFAWLESLAARQGVDAGELSQPGAEADLPDFLQPASPEAIERANTPVDWSTEDASDNEAVTADADTAEMPEWVKALAPAEDEAAARPLEELPEVDPADLPEWLRPAEAVAPAAETPAVASSDDDAAFAWLEGLAAAQGADPETLTAPATDADVPDWLRAAPVEAEPAAELPVQPEAAATETPAIASSDDDAAFAWLEGLAAAQGADPSTLSTAVLEDGAAEGEVPGSEAPLPTVNLPDWLSQDLANTPTEASQPTAASVDAGAVEDDGFAWLESLAARQGADPETLSVAGEPSRSPASAEIDMPEWLKADLSATSEPTTPGTPVTPPTSSDRTATRPLAEPEPGLQGVAWLRKPLESDTPPSDRGEITLPDWLQDEMTPPAASTAPVAAVEAPEPSIIEPTVDEAPAGPPITTSDKRTSMLAGKLAERKRARESEIQDRFERQRAAREAAQREIETKLANRRAGLAPEPAIVASDLPTAPLPQMAEAAAPQRAATGPLDLGRPRWRPRSAPAFADVAPDALLTRSREQLAGGQEATAMSGYTHLIKTGQHVDVILVELQAHIGRGKAGAIAYRTLGDAQMKAGHLQDALVSYRTALERA